MPNFSALGQTMYEKSVTIFAPFSILADMKRYVRHLKIGRTSMISGRLVTSMSQNFDVLSTFCGRKYARLDVIQNTV